MNKLISLLIPFILFNLNVSGQASLKIVIKNLKNNDGHLVLDLRDGEDKGLRTFSEKIADNQCTITFDNLKPGNYSFKYFHDENNNKKMDKYWIGAPKEGVGFSNDAKGKYGPPDFQDTVFEVKKDIIVVCKAYYLKL